MRGRFIFFMILMIAAVLEWSCEDPNTLAVSKVFSNNNLQTIYSDTFSVATSTVQLDTFLTNGTGTVLLGRYQDPELGMISASSYLQLSYGASFLPSFQSYFDSMVLVMYYNKTFSGDTTQTLKINGYQVTDYIVPRNVPVGNIKLSALGAYSGFFSSTKFTYSPTPIFSGTVKMFPHRDTVTIRLPDSFGAKWFSKAQNDSGRIFSNSSIFSNAFFRGLYLEPDASSTACVAGFTANKLRLRIYYRRMVNGLLKNAHADFTINNGYQFNHIMYDRTGTSLSALQPYHAISSTLTGNTSYVQAGTGLVTRLDFPSVKSFFAGNPNVMLNGAYLVMYPEPGSFPKNLLPPTQLELFSTDATNIPTNTFTGATTSIVYDYILGINTFYSFSLYSYLFTQVKNNTNYIAPLLVVPGGSVGGSVQRTYLGDKYKGYNRIKLQLYYTHVPN